uniref:NAD-dependent epimerase/dehydratase family protein n=1 Tax=Polynucleobacter sp. TaxID=2029855 RepID=UPI004047DAF3
MTCLITGATGFIGGRLLRTSDRALVRASTGVPGSIVGDLLDLESLKIACKDIETVIHCAGHAHAFTSTDKDAHWRVNLEGTRNMLKASVASGVKHFIFLSSVKAMADPYDFCVDERWLGKPLTPYGCAKLAAEAAVLEVGEKHGLEVTNLRLAMVYGNGGNGNLERMARAIRLGWFPPLPETQNRRSIVHVADVVRLIHMLQDHRPVIANGKTYIIADSKAYSGCEIYDAIRQSLGKPAMKWRASKRLLKTAGFIGDKLESCLHRQLPLNSEAINRLLGSAWYSALKVEEELGWKAQIGLLDGVQEMLGFCNV